MSHYLFFVFTVISNMVVLQVLKDFAGATSIHGLSFVVDSRLSIFKRVTWALIFTAAIMWVSIQLHFAVTCKLRIKFLKISNQFVASEPPKIRDRRNYFFHIRTWSSWPHDGVIFADFWCFWIFSKGLPFELMKIKDF